MRLLTISSTKFFPFLGMHFPSLKSGSVLTNKLINYFYLVFLKRKKNKLKR